jgi:hypothetical protein
MSSLSSSQAGNRRGGHGGQDDPHEVKLRNERLKSILCGKEKILEQKIGLKQKVW